MASVCLEINLCRSDARMSDPNKITYNMALDAWHLNLHGGSIHGGSDRAHPGKGTLGSNCRLMEAATIYRLTGMGKRPSDTLLN